MSLNSSFISLFAGCGGETLGFMQAGFKCLATVERSPDACATIWSNLAVYGYSKFKIQDELLMQKTIKALAGKWETHNTFFFEDGLTPIKNVYCYDMTVLTPEDLMKDLNIKPGKLGVICGGPPCQGFSTSNSQRNVDDNRNTLVFRFLYFVEVIKPKFFHIENVPGILTLGKSKGDKEGPFPKWIRESSEKAGYVLEYQILNAMNYGVPQSRRRVIFIGIRKDLYEKGYRHQFPNPTHTWDYFESKSSESFIDLLSGDKEPFVTCCEAIGDLNRWKLSSSRDEDCKHLPDGHPDRYSNGKEDGSYYVGEDLFVYYRDRFTGNYHKGNHCADYFIPVDSESDYMSCLNCGKLNLIARSRCHYCRTEMSPKLIDCL